VTVALTFGTFDTPHAGHAAFLRRCERFADEVIVAVRSDDMVQQLRGCPPVFDFDERARLIGALGYQVRESKEPGRALIEELVPDVLAVGSDWARRDVLGRYDVDQDLIDRYGIALTFIPYTPGISTTELKRRLGR
jgi:glycerol-3-phosphate cytidylyltransferase